MYNQFISIQNNLTTTRTKRIENDEEFEKREEDAKRIKR